MSRQKKEPSRWKMLNDAFMRGEALIMTDSSGGRHVVHSMKRIKDGEYYLTAAGWRCDAANVDTFRNLHEAQSFLYSGEAAAAAE